MKEYRPQYYLLIEKPRRSRRKIVPLVLGILLTLALMLSVIFYGESLLGYRL